MKEGGGRKAEKTEKWGGGGGGGGLECFFPHFFTVSHLGLRFLPNTVFFFSLLIFFFSNP